MKKEGSVESAYLHQRTLGPVLGASRSGARSFHTPWAAMKEGIGRPTTLSAAVRPVRLPVQFRVPAGGGPRAVLSAGSCRRRPRTAPQPRSVPAVPAELREARRGWGELRRGAARTRNNSQPGLSLCKLCNPKPSSDVLGSFPALPFAFHTSHAFTVRHFNPGQQPNPRLQPLSPALCLPPPSPRNSFPTTPPSPGLRVTQQGEACCALHPNLLCISTPFAPLSFSRTRKMLATQGSKLLQDGNITTNIDIHIFMFLWRTQFARKPLLWGRPVPP